LSLEIQELPDIVRVIILLSLSRGIALDKPTLKHRIDRYCAGYVCVEMDDIDKALKEMCTEGAQRDY
jgi:hypothetical protein